MKTLVIILAVLIIVIWGKYLSLNSINKNMNTKNTIPVSVKEIKKFSCKNLFGFSFEYPVFKNWESDEQKEDSKNGCKIFFNQLKNKDYEVSRQMSVYLEPKAEKVNPEDLKQMKKNKFSINYIYTENNVGDFTKIYKFFGPSFDIKIGLLAGSEEDGFSEKTFWQIVIDSFNFK